MKPKVSDLSTCNKKYTRLIIHSNPLQQPFIKACKREWCALLGIRAASSASTLPSLELLRSYDVKPHFPVFIPKMLADRGRLPACVLPGFTILIGTGNFNEIRELINR